MAPLTQMRPVVSMTSTTLRQTCAFSTTTALATKTVPPTRFPSKLIPPYPYGERLVYKQSNTGLYGSARIRFGNTVSQRNNKARRTWKPNVHVKIFYLPEVKANVKVKLTMRVLKTISQEGGLQNYLLKDKPQRIKELGPGGWNLRWLLMQSTAVQERLNAQRREMGIEEKEVVNRDDMIHFALDYATPGPLSIRAQKTLAELKGNEIGPEIFALGDEALLAGEVTELTPEEEAALDLNEALSEPGMLDFMEEVDPKSETKVKAEKDGVRDV